MAICQLSDLEIHMDKQRRGYTHINSDEMDLGVSVLSGLGSGHVDDL
jgi:hypothetical protein